jgi:hypothetical protein
MTSNDTNELNPVPNGDRPALGPAGLTKREYFAAHSDIPWDACVKILTDVFGVKNPTSFEIVKYRTGLMKAQADELLKHLEQ